MLVPWRVSFKFEHLISAKKLVSVFLCRAWELRFWLVRAHRGQKNGGEKRAESHGRKSGNILKNVMCPKSNFVSFKCFTKTSWEKNPQSLSYRFSASFNIVEHRLGSQNETSTVSCCFSTWRTGYLEKLCLKKPPEFLEPNMSSNSKKGPPVHHQDLPIQQCCLPRSSFDSETFMMNKMSGVLISVVIFFFF